MLSNVDSESETPLDVESEEQISKSDIHQAIKVVNLTKNYTSFTGAIQKIAVNKLCTYFEQGKVCAVLGQNGAGSFISVLFWNNFN